MSKGYTQEDLLFLRKTAFGLLLDTYTVSSKETALVVIIQNIDRILKREGYDPE